MKKFFNFIFEIFKTAILALVIVFPIRYFLFQPFIVSGNSMYPGFENGDYLIVDEISYRMREPERGEVIIFRAPDQASSRYIKRIVGLPGETIEISDGVIIISNDTGVVEVLDESEYLSGLPRTSGQLKVSLEENQYFVLGDNRMFSSDSRSWGTLPKDNIIGRAFLRAWPADSLAVIEKPAYNLFISN